jgi:hypothetical protein
MSWETVAFGIFPPRFGGPHHLLPRVVLNSAKRLAGEDTLLVLRLRMCGMWVCSLLCNLVFCSVSYSNVCRDDIKKNLRNRAEGVCLFGRGSDKFTTCVYAYVELY